MIENFPTDATFVGHFSSVNSLVLSKDGFAAEGFPTLAALVWPFSSVDSVVLDERVFAAKGFPTFAAFIMPLSTTQGLHTRAVTLRSAVLGTARAS